MLTGQSRGGGSWSSHLGRAGGVWWRVIWGRGGGGERRGETRWNGLLHTSRQVLFISGSPTVSVSDWLVCVWDMRAHRCLFSLVVLTVGWSLRAASPLFLPAWRLQSSLSSGRRRSKRPWTGECLSKYEFMWGAEPNLGLYSLKIICSWFIYFLLLNKMWKMACVFILFMFISCLIHQAFMAHTVIYWEYGAPIWREKHHIFIYLFFKRIRLSKKYVIWCRCCYLNGQKVKWKSDIM